MSVNIPVLVRKSPTSMLYYAYRFLWEDDYPAKMNELFVKDMILLYTEPGEIVCDPMVGAGTVTKAAVELNRKGVGFDINEEAIEIARQKPHTRLEVADARKLPLPDNSVDLILTSPPFGLNTGTRYRQKYTNLKGDIGNCKNYGAFRQELKKCLKEMYRILKPNRVCIIEAREKTYDKRLNPMAAYLTVDAEEVGFTPHTWGIQANFLSYRLYRFGRKCQGRWFPTFVPSHIHVLVFWKGVAENEC